MNDLQRLQLRQSEVRQRLNELLGLEERTDEQRAELEKLTAEGQALEPQIRAALVAADTNPIPAVEGAGTAEARELAALRKRARIGGYMGALAAGKPLQGAEREYNEAMGASSNGIPLSFFEPEAEQRAVTSAPSTGTPVTTGPIAPYVFADSLAPDLGIEIRQVGPGAYGIPRITTAPAGAAGPVAAAGTADSTAAVMDVVTGTPRRLAAQVTTNLEGIWSLGAEYEDALRQSLRQQLSAKLDEQLLTGGATAPALNGLVTQLTAPTAQGALAVWDTAIDQVVDAGIDGLWAGSLRDLFVVVNVDGYKYVSKLFTAPVTSGTPGEQSAASYLGRETAGFRTHSRMPDTPGSGNLNKNATVLIARRGMPSLSRAIVPTWGELTVDDPYTAAATGQRTYTFNIGIGNLVLVHSAAYALTAWQVVA